MKTSNILSLLCLSAGIGNAAPINQRDAKGVFAHSTSGIGAAHGTYIYALGGSNPFDKDDNEKREAKGVLGHSAYVYTLDLSDDEDDEDDFDSEKRDAKGSFAHGTYAHALSINNPFDSENEKRDAKGGVFTHVYVLSSSNPFKNDNEKREAKGTFAHSTSGIGGAHGTYVYTLSWPWNKKDNDE